MLQVKEMLSRKSFFKQVFAGLENVSEKSYS